MITIEDKDLLLKDLSARLPYGVKCKTNIVGHPVKLAAAYINGDVVFGALMTEIDKVKPYLFPLSSMTKEQEEEYHSICMLVFIEGEGEGEGGKYLDTLKSFDWLNAHHFDYRGLIEKGLAIDATGLDIY